VLYSAALVAIEIASNKFPPESKTMTSTLRIQQTLPGMMHSFFMSNEDGVFRQLSMNVANSVFNSSAPRPSNSGDALGQLFPEYKKNYKRETS
jgi:hypothetical protein